MLEEVVNTFLSKVAEKLADYAVDYAKGTVTKMKDYKATFDTLKGNLKSLSDTALDVEDEVKYAEQSGQKKRKRQVENWLMDVKKLESEVARLEVDMEFKGFINRFLGGDQGRQLSERVDRLLEQSRQFGQLLLDCESKAVPLFTPRLVGENFEENLERIWKHLVMDRLKSVAIHGMGGIGKTTLVKHIHNRFLQRTEQLVIWITVSQVFDIKSLQSEIARAMHLNLSDERNEDKRAARLNIALSQRKKFVLIFDDVWENISLDKVGDPLSVEGCKLIITTRSLDVCNEIGFDRVVSVEKLSKANAWSLFRETLGGDMALSPQAQEYAECMANKCDGLPLGIITTAGSMRGKTDDFEWSNALTELQKSIMSKANNKETIFDILKYSFDRLAQGEEKYNGYTTLQHCFLYCCLYPEDSKIAKAELIKRFISEELLDTKRSRIKQLDQGHVVLKKLVRVCLLESDDTSWVKMHDLVRGMALRLTEGKYMAIDAQDFSLKEILNEEKDLEKISLRISWSSYRTLLRDIPTKWSPNCPKLTTLIFLDDTSLKLIPSSFFLRMCSLHVLDLSSTGIVEFPDSISNLGSLKTLLLCLCKSLKSMPDLRNLKTLKELDLSYTSIEEVPKGMEELVNLECLKIVASRLRNLPSNLLHNFPKLQCLHLPCHIEAPMKEIEKLKQLDEFHGRVKDICDFNQLMGCQSSFFKEYTQSYRVVVSSQEYPDQKPIVGLPINDKKVILSGINFNEETRRNMRILARDIQHLTFEKCVGLQRCLLDDLQQLNINLNSLKSLQFQYCEGVKCLLKAPGESEYTFRNLEEIWLFDLPDFEEIIILQRAREVVASSHPAQFLSSSLKRLEIVRCNKLKTPGLPPLDLQNLEKISIINCGEMEEIIQIPNKHQVRNQPLLLHLPKLRELRLWNLPRLKSICNAIVLCNSIQRIWMERCTKLKKLPLIFGEPDYESHPSSLREIIILDSEVEWWESLEFEHPSLAALLQPFLWNREG